MTISTRSFALALSLLLGLAACSNDAPADRSDGGARTDGGSDSDGGGSEDVDAQVVGCGDFLYPGAGGDCQPCMEDSCCAELAACATGTECADLVACAEACADDMACQTACGSSRPAGLADFRAMVSCASGSCDVECNDPGAICDTGLTTNNRECNTCLTETCCTQYTACAADTACMACLTGTATEGCDTNTLYSDTLMCKASCDTTCPAGICDTGLSTNDVDCDVCLSTTCCADISACQDDSACFACLLDESGAACPTNELFRAFKTCSATCDPMCAG